MTTAMATNATTSPSTTRDAEKKLKRVKIVIPFSLKCDKCGRITNKGQKYWGLKEKVGMDSFFEVEIYRYHFKCHCPSLADFSIISDLGRYDYIIEAGATLAPKSF